MPLVRSATAPPQAQDRQIRNIFLPSCRIQFSPTIRIRGVGSTLFPTSSIPRTRVVSCRRLPLSLLLHGRHDGSCACSCSCWPWRTGGTRCSWVEARFAWRRLNGVDLRFLSTSLKYKLGFGFQHDQFTIEMTKMLDLGGLGLLSFCRSATKDVKPSGV